MQITQSNFYNANLFVESLLIVRNENAEWSWYQMVDGREETWSWDQEQCSKSG